MILYYKTIYILYQAKTIPLYSLQPRQDKILDTYAVTPQSLPLTILPMVKQKYELNISFSFTLYLPELSYREKWP